MSIVYKDEQTPSPLLVRVTINQISEVENRGVVS